MFAPTVVINYLLYRKKTGEQIVRPFFSLLMFSSYFTTVPIVFGAMPAAFASSVSMCIASA